MAPPAAPESLASARVLNASPEAVLLDLAPQGECLR
jgi:hypothetical protein